MKIKSALAKLDESTDFSHPQSGYNPERRIRDVTDTLTFIAHFFTAEIPRLFANYQVGPKYDGRHYFPEANVQGFSTRTEGAILHALKMASQGKPVPNNWDQLVVLAEYGENAQYNPPKFTLHSIPTIIEGKFKRGQ